MPNTVRAGLVARQLGASPWRGKVDHTDQIAIDITALTDREIDDDGYLKAGVPFTKDGALVGVGDVVWGCTIEPLNVLNRTPYNASTTKAALIAAAGTQEVAVGTIGQINRKVIEDLLGSALTADELAGFEAAGCTVKLLG